MHRELTSNISLGEIFQERQRVLEHVNLTIADGERIAFVGASGAGKSTLVQLISRFYDVTQGSVKIGGVNVKDIDYEELLSQVSVVFQQSFLDSVK